MTRPLARCVALLLALGAASAGGQDAPFFYPAPAAGSVTTVRDVPYAKPDTTQLHMDVYRPASPGAKPAVVFFNVAFGRQRGHAFYAGWARAAASKGLVAIVPDLRSGRAPEDFQALVAHLSAQAATYGIDRDAITVYAGSGNVFTALPMLQDPGQTAVKAAVMYYGTAPVTTFRRDLPILFVRAGLDRPQLNGGPRSGIVGLVAEAMAQNAPITVINHPFGHHAFEMIDDDAGTRDVIEQTIEFIKRSTAPGYLAALRRGLPEATATSYITSGDMRAAAAAYGELVRIRPEAAALRLSYGDALLGDKQYASACSQFEQLKGKGLGPRDLGLPAARACTLAGDADGAMKWLQSIPKRFLPPTVEQDSSLVTLRTRADFRALFQP